MMKIVDQGYMQPHVTVEVQRTIKVGGQYRIAASYGYLGIEDGIVTVRDILSKEDITSVDGVDHDLYEEANNIEAYKDAELGGLEGDDYANQLRYLDESLWIAYYYAKQPDEIYVFPLEEFVDHTTTTI